MNKLLESIDFALARYRDCWLHHYAAGDPSWDTFVRETHNPIYTGKEPYLWPVNGFLFRNPPTDRWYAYVGLYPRGYWPGGPCLVMRERTEGGWEEIGFAVRGDATMFDGDGHHPGCMPDVSVVFANGLYHMVYDWANPDNSRGGIAYAWAEYPEGPFHRLPAPIHEDSHQPTLIGKYVRAYAATLIQREHDWIILHDMSTPGNAGGAWAMACMTAPQAEGPYTSPTLLLYPQSNRYLPACMEYYPAFAYAGYIYAPATSVAQNRSFQCIFRAPLEEAHRPEAWLLYQHGSVWHAEGLPSESQGIWGQTFSGQVDPDGHLRAYFTSKTRDDIGTVHLARRPWSTPYQDGFVLSAPNTNAFAVLRADYQTFSVQLACKASGNWALCWQCRGPMGPDSPVANATAHALMRTHRMEWQSHADAWRVVEIAADGTCSVYCSGQLPQNDKGTLRLSIDQTADRVTLMADNSVACVLACAAVPGRLELVAESGTILRVNTFRVTGNPLASHEAWLAVEALAGAASDISGSEWKRVESGRFRFGFGYESLQPGARAKWNYLGGSFKLFAPRSLAYGHVYLSVDGEDIGLIDCHAPESEASTMVFEHHLPSGFHCVAIQPRSGTIPCDVLEIESPDITHFEAEPAPTT